MKAARLVERRKPLELTDLPDPVPAPGEVVIEVEAEGICRTDWHVDSYETLGFSVITGF